MSRQQTPSSATPENAPSIGIISQTLVGSCVIKQIIPARIRHKEKNDVLFISSRSVTIKEAFGNYTLREVAVKDDFDSSIQSARILGDPRECDGGDKYNRLRADTRVYSNDEWPVKADEKMDSDEASLDSPELPPHILVLTLESAKLVFLCALNGNFQQPNFLWSQHPLPVAKWPNEQVGRHLAVDPK